MKDLREDESCVQKYAREAFTKITSQQFGSEIKK